MAAKNIVGDAVRPERMHNATASARHMLREVAQLDGVAHVHATSKGTPTAFMYDRTLSFEVLETAHEHGYEPELVRLGSMETPKWVVRFYRRD